MNRSVETMQEELGRLERVDLRQAWEGEAREFTPWLARPENLEQLSDALGVSLEFEALEKAVGRFRADILCRDLQDDRYVLIENQLESTDHNHLGQLLTYASGLDAHTIVWVAKSFGEEHRSALDWLNKITKEEFRFFGVEVVLWRIGTSLAAPMFNLVSKPNNWSRELAREARALDEEELTEVRRLQLAYWEAFLSILEGKRAAFLSSRTPLAQSWMNFPVGRTGFRVGAVMLRPSQKIRAELYISHAHAKAFFKGLEAQKAAVEEELGYELSWEELPGKRDVRIAAYRDANPEEEGDWPLQHEWLADRLIELHRTFSNRIRQLSAQDWLAQDDATDG